MAIGEGSGERAQSAAVTADTSVNSQVVALDAELPLTLRQKRDLARGYAINRLYVAIAYFGEIVLIAASLVGAWLFALKYGDGSNRTLITMMLAPASYAVVELCRVPMAIAFRTQRNIVLKATLFIGLICAAGVTVKSLAQLGEQMFHPRLIAVVDAKERLDAAAREGRSFEAKLGVADALVTQRGRELASIEERSRALAAEMGGIRPPTCVPVSGVDRNGRAYRTCRPTAEDPRGPIIKANLDRASAERTQAQRLLDETTAQRAALDRTAVDQQVSVATTAHRNAVRDSQLHSFTAMAFMKSPSEVSDREIHAFLFVFVFLPAIFASLAATLLALGAVTRVQRPVAPVALSSNAGAYVLGPLAEHIIRQTTEAVHKSAQAEVAEAAAAARVAGARIKAVS